MFVELVIDLELLYLPRSNYQSIIFSKTPFESMEIGPLFVDNGPIIVFHETVITLQ